VKTFVEFCILVDKRECYIENAGCQESCDEFNRMKPNSSALTPREKQLRDLATAYDSFVDLKHNVEEGTQVGDARVTEVA